MTKVIGLGLAAIAGLVLALFVGGLLGGWIAHFFYGNDDSWEVGVTNGMAAGTFLYLLGLASLVAWYVTGKDQ